jgi:hypothetical protein
MTHPTPANADPATPADAALTREELPLTEEERQVLARGDVRLKPRHPGSKDDPEAKLHLDGEPEAADDDLHIDTDSLPVFGSDANRG